MTEKFWEVQFSAKAYKQKNHLPISIQTILFVLIKDIERWGPSLGLECKGWPNFGKIRVKNFQKEAYHCHLKKGRPTYVACWYIENKNVKIVEVFYVGTHEGAPY